MPITKGAKKALRASKRKRLFNIVRKESVADVTKKIRKALASGKKDEAAKLLPLAQKAIDKAVKRGVLKKNTAARKKAGLVRTIKAAK